MILQLLDVDFSNQTYACYHADIVPETITVGELRELLQKQQQQKALAAANGMPC